MSGCWLGRRGAGAGEKEELIFPEREGGCGRGRDGGEEEGLISPVGVASCWGGRRGTDEEEPIIPVGEGRKSERGGMGGVADMLPAWTPPLVRAGVVGTLERGRGRVRKRPCGGGRRV